MFFNKNLYVNIFLKNFIFFKKKTKTNLLFIIDFKNFYFYFFYNFFHSIYFLNFFYKFNIFNNFKNFFYNGKLIKSISSDDEFKKIKKNFKKLYFYKITDNKNIFLNKNSFRSTNLIKFNFFEKNIFKLSFYTFKCNFFYKNKNKKNSKIFFNFNFLYKTNFFFFYFFNIFVFLSLNFHFYNIKIKRNITFYINIFKNFNIIKNLNQFFLNKNFWLLNNNLLDNFKINLHFLKNINYCYNNQYPLIFFKKFNKNVFYKFNLKKEKNFLNLFNLYILNFFEFFFKKNFFLKISNKIQLNQYKRISLFLQSYNNNIKFQKFFDSNEMIELVCIVFLYKDLTLLKNWIIVILNNINIKNHKKFLMIFNDFIVENFPNFSTSFNIKGFYFCVKGKIGLSGNAKKKKFFFKKGLLKVSSKNFKIDNQRFFIKTNCGSLGINMILTY